MSELQAGPTREWQHRNLACCVAQENKEEKGNEEKDEDIVAEKDVQVVAEEELEEVDLGSSSQESRLIKISASLTRKEKSKLVLLLKGFKDVFAWDYSEMPRLDPELVAHTLNVDPEAKPIAQPTRIFHTEIEGQIVKEVQKLLAVGFIKPIQHLRWLSNIVPVKKKNRQIRCCVDFRNLNRVCSRMSSNCQT